jgi:phosphoribosylformylglycinamidine synthase
MNLRDVCGREDGAPPAVDLATEKRNGDFVRELIAAGVVTAVHDISDGGLLVALAEMAMAGKLGATLGKPPSGIAAHAFWFGEDQARYVVTVPAAQLPSVLAKASQANVVCGQIGTTGGDVLVIGDEGSVRVKQLDTAFESWLPNYMAGNAA